MWSVYSFTWLGRLSPLCPLKASQWYRINTLTLHRCTLLEASSSTVVTLYHAKDLDIYIFRYFYIYIFIYLDISMDSSIAIYVHTRWRVNHIDSYRYPTDRIFSICCTRKIKQCLTLRLTQSHFKSQTVFNYFIICYDLFTGYSHP